MSFENWQKITSVRYDNVTGYADNNAYSNTKSLATLLTGKVTCCKIPTDKVTGFSLNMDGKLITDRISAENGFDC